MSSRLERSTTDKMIAGVCGGIASYLQIEVTWIRLGFAVLALVGGVGILAYIVLAIIMPLPGQRPVAGDTRTTAPDTTEPYTTAGATATPVDTERRRQFAGYALIAIGLVFLLNNQGVFRFLEWRIIWPLALVAIGALLLTQRLRR
jgi:phage shock protein PspC (stress-responsive transcriptional regulator)